MGDQALRQGLVRWVEAVQPLGEQPHDAEARRPGLASCPSVCLLPAQEQVGADVLGSLALGIPDEAAQDACRGAKVEPEAAPDGKVAVKFVAEAAHRTPPAAGQGCATERRPSMSSLA